MCSHSIKRFFSDFYVCSAFDFALEIKLTIRDAQKLRKFTLSRIKKRKLGTKKKHGHARF